ncbi:hypothetical protein PHJA_002088700 [Phtheirospermum japonicum]|uniref:DUF7870 domain-containing protein n=1 Tax=Phtheirospermum japonicum TaxID=374723 RepID=A0A830CJG6_9LAMI|nr:hypothetical protein PHJA_002088700 [Phtheirospermum japonicum]
MDNNKLGLEIRPKICGLDSNESNGVGIGLKSDTLLVINLPHSRALRIMSRLVLFAMLLLALSSIYSVLMKASPNVSLYEHDDSDCGNGFKILPILLRNLVEEGLIKKGHRGFVAGDIEDDFEFLRDAGIDLITGADLKNEDARQVFDFVFATSFQRVPAVDGLIKVNGLVIAPLGRDPSKGLRLLSTYKIVYLRRFKSTVVAMRKMGPYTTKNSKEVLCGVTTEEKRDALKGLEDVYLEPPRRAALELKKPRFTSRKIKFLPDLLKDTLDEYPRRVFISDDSGAVDWFYKNYPMRDQEFEVYNVEVGVNSNDGSFQEMGVSNWMTEKVKREDYVVMKAEAQVVEEMLKDKTLCLIDELFLECKNQWVDGEEENGSKRAYWECLTLYGKVRDEGIAVHQWWD